MFRHELKLYGAPAALGVAALGLAFAGLAPVYLGLAWAVVLASWGWSALSAMQLAARQRAELGRVQAKLEELRLGLGKEASGAQEEVARVRSLVQDAIAKLSGAFGQLNQQSSQQ